VTSAPTAERLIALMRATAVAELPADAPLTADTPLREVPINSRRMRTFLVEVEDAFDHQWDIDTPDGVFATFATLAEFLDRAADHHKELSP
jgi:hypothetical protein